MKPTATFAIIGLGLMGGSYAMGLTKRGYTVDAVDAQPAALQWAKDHGLIRAGAPAGDTVAVDAILGGADYVVIALYPHDILPWLQAHKAALKPGALLTDLAGVKGHFVEPAQALLHPQHEFIACHPMAGREVSGVQNADDAMFCGANFLITPTARNTQRGLAFAYDLANTLGFARISEMSVAQHDERIGYVSQLTHAIAVSLMNANDDPALPAVTGDSFRDLTRIADINETLWSELFLANRTALIGEIDSFTACLADIRQKLTDGDGPGLQALMRQSTQRRRAFNKKPANTPSGSEGGSGS